MLSRFSTYEEDLDAADPVYWKCCLSRMAQSPLHETDVRELRSEILIARLIPGRFPRNPLDETANAFPRCESGFVMLAAKYTGIGN